MKTGGTGGGYCSVLVQLVGLLHERLACCSAEHLHLLIQCHARNYLKHNIYFLPTKQHFMYSHDQAFSVLLNMCGRYVRMHTAQTLCPVELYQSDLMCVQPNSVKTINDMQPLSIQCWYLLLKKAD